MEVKDMPIAAIVAGATSLLPLIQDIIDGANNGMTQEELNAKWEAMRAHFANAKERWEAAGQAS